mmetsp:Transcript_1815/g.5017  ORF Transcript_1815/g.5017 Transcript_1815/m.5017 type:complete len:327 (-) Transcript_1815:907-1887(-)
MNLYREALPHHQLSQSHPSPRHAPLLPAPPTPAWRPRRSSCPAATTRTRRRPVVGTNHTLRVVHTDDAPRLLLHTCWHGPGLENILGGDVPELGAPHTDVLALWVVCAGLPWYVESVESAAYASSDGHPVAPVGAHVIVQQKGLKVVSTITPVEAEVERQEAAHILPTTVAHETCGGELSHVGIHQWHARLPVLPRIQQFLGFAILSYWRRWGRRESDAALLEHPPPIFEGKEAEIVPPQQLKHQPVGALVLDPLALILGHLLVYPPRREAAVSQPWRQLAAVVGTQHPVACVEVGGDVVAPNIVRQALQTLLLATSEVEHSWLAP